MLWATSKWRSTSPKMKPPPPHPALQPPDQPQQQPRRQRRQQQQQPQHQRHDQRLILTSLATTQGMSTQPSCRLRGGLKNVTVQTFPRHESRRPGAGRGLQEADDGEVPEDGSGF